MSRRRRKSYNNVYPFIMILTGLLLIVCFLPLWVWVVILGLALIVFGIKIYYR